MQHTRLKCVLREAGKRGAYGRARNLRMDCESYNVLVTGV